MIIVMVSLRVLILKNIKNDLEKEIEWLIIYTNTK